MGISGITNYNNTQQYIKNSNNKSNHSAVQMNTSSNITLCMHDAEGNKATTCVGFPNGGSASVFKSDSYTESNPEYLVKYWDKNGNEQETVVNPKEVTPSNASFIEMMAYSTYLDAQGYTSNAFGDFITSAMGTEVSINYDYNNINKKFDFKTMVKGFMEMQYNAGNLAGYLSFKKFYDYMNIN